jgi:hypothetical protein
MSRPSLQRQQRVRPRHALALVDNSRMLQFLASPFSHASLADAAARHSTLVPPPDDPALHGLLTAFAATSGWPAMRLLQADADGKLLTLCRAGADAGVPDAWTQAEARAWVDGQPVDLDDPGDGAAGESTPAGGGRRWRVAALRPLHFEGAVVGLLVGYHGRHARLDDEHSAALAPLRAALAELLGRRLQSRRARDHDDRLRDFTRASCDWMWELDAGLRYRFL